MQDDGVKKLIDMLSFNVRQFSSRWKRLESLRNYISETNRRKFRLNYPLRGPPKHLNELMVKIHE